MRTTNVGYYAAYATTGDSMARRFGVGYGGVPAPVYTSDTYLSNGEKTIVGTGFTWNRILNGVKSFFSLFGALGSLLGGVAGVAGGAMAANPYVAAIAVGAPAVSLAGTQLVNVGMSATGLDKFSYNRPSPSWQSRYSPFPDTEWR